MCSGVQEREEPARWLPLLSPECKSAATSTAVTIFNKKNSSNHQWLIELALPESGFVCYN